MFVETSPDDDDLALIEEEVVKFSEALKSSDSLMESIRSAISTNASLDEDQIEDILTDLQQNEDNYKKTLEYSSKQKHFLY